jgi:hypothetical protein
MLFSLASHTPYWLLLPPPLQHFSLLHVRVSLFHCAAVHDTPSHQLAKREKKTLLICFGSWLSVFAFFFFHYPYLLCFVSVLSLDWVAAERLVFFSLLISQLYCTYLGLFTLFLFVCWLGNWAGDYGIGMAWERE